MANSKKEKLNTGEAAVIVGAALALFVGVFLFVANQYGGRQETQVTQHKTPQAPPADELPITPVTPPASPPVNTPADIPPVSQ